MKRILIAVALASSLRAQPVPSGRGVSSVASVPSSISGTGTITTAGTTAIVGVGTTFTSLRAGQWLVISGESAPLKIALIANATHLTLASAAGTTASGLSWSYSECTYGPVVELSTTTARLSYQCVNGLYTAIPTSGGGGGSYIATTGATTSAQADVRGTGTSGPVIKVTSSDANVSGAFIVSAPSTIADYSTAIRATGSEAINANTPADATPSTSAIEATMQSTGGNGQAIYAHVVDVSSGSGTNDALWADSADTHTDSHAIKATSKGGEAIIASHSAVVTTPIVTINAANLAGSTLALNILKPSGSATIAADGTMTGFTFVGNVPTATSLAANGTNCLSGNANLGSDASGNAEGCFAVVVPTRSVSTSSPLGGGGALSADLTLTCTTCATSSNDLSFFATTTSAQLRGLISDEQGTGGGVVFATGPTITSLVPTFTDVTTGNVSTSAHGLVPKADNNAAHYLDGTGAFSTPASGGSAPFADSNTSALIKGTADATKLFGFDLSNMTASNTISVFIRGTSAAPIMDLGAGGRFALGVTSSDVAFRKGSSVEGGKSIADVINGNASALGDIDANCFVIAANQSLCSDGGFATFWDLAHTNVSTAVMKSLMLRTNATISDAYIARGSAAGSFNFGSTDGGTDGIIVAATHKAADVSGSNISSSTPLVLQGGVGTGTGTDRGVEIRAGAPAASSSTAHTATTKAVIGQCTPLTDNVTTNLFDVAFPALASAGGTVTATIRASDGTDIQSFTQAIVWAAVNKAGTLTKSVKVVPTDLISALGASAVSSGTISTTWDVSLTSSVLTMTLNANASLTPSGTNSMQVCWTLFNNSMQAVTPY